MRTIKFRGVGTDGKTSYGSFVSIMPMSSFPAIIDGNGFYHEVKPESIAQLVGYDANGKEVYEGDIVIRYDSKEEFDEAPENGVLREVVLYTDVEPDLESYYCFLKDD